MLTHNPQLRGFTLIELMITLAVLGILLATGVPSFTRWVQNSKIRTTAESIQNGLQLARTEAIRRNERVRFVLSSNAGWAVSTNSGTQIQARSSGEGSSNITITTTPSTTTTVTFNSLGIVTTNSDSSASITQVEVDVPTSVLPASQSRELRVEILSGGQIRMCDPYFTDAGDPRKC